MISMTVLCGIVSLASANPFLSQPFGMSSMDSGFDVPTDHLSSMLPPARPEVLEALNDWYQHSRSTKKVMPLNFTVPTPPCCSDTITSIACRRLLNNNPMKFSQRCEYDPDFSLIQCCNTCGMETAEKRFSTFFANNQGSHHCFDRHSAEFCARFMQKNDVWGSSTYSCDGQFATLAFRICRKTCNFCRKDIYSVSGVSGSKYAPTPCGKTPQITRVAADSIIF